MARRPLIVLADDLTGAAEVAAIAHEAGLHVVILTRLPRQPIAADVLVLDTDTRLDPSARARRRVRSRAALLSALPHAGVFKKTDSVLRGPVLAELAACSAAFGLRRTLLVAGNPSLGRTIRAGSCYIAGQLINQTAFATDPHHPARSAAVLDLLHATGRADVFCHAPGNSLPRHGIIVGEHRSTADTTHWLRALDKHTLPAGGADFFRAWLHSRIPPRTRPSASEAPPGPVLLLHGTTATPAANCALLFKGVRPPAASRVCLDLRRHGAAAVAASPSTRNDPLAPARIALGFASLARALRTTSHPFRHLVIVGGATAASVLRTLGWNRLTVLQVWAPGVVSLQPAGTRLTITLKPGSYPWPAGLQRVAPRLFPKP